MDIIPVSRPIKQENLQGSSSTSVAQKSSPQTPDRSVPFFQLDESFTVGASWSTILFLSFHANFTYLNTPYIISKIWIAVVEVLTDFVWLPRANSSFFSLRKLILVKARVLPTLMVPARPVNQLFSFVWKTAQCSGDTYTCHSLLQHELCCRFDLPMKDTSLNKFKTDKPNFTPRNNCTHTIQVCRDPG